MTTVTDGLTPAVAFPPGEYLADELAERGWSIVEFASIIGRPVQAVSEIVNGRKEITAETALDIASATGTEAETWLRLQDMYRLWKLRQEPTPRARLSDVERRARLAGIVPVRELSRRGVVPGDADIGAQERAVCDLLGIRSLNESPRFAMAARRSGQTSQLTPPQTAWLACVRRSASRLRVAPFDAQGLYRLGENLTRTVREPDGLSSLPARFAESGVRLVHVVRFTGSKIDGSAHHDDDGPVIALSGRIAKFDSVLFTLLHEVAHVLLGHVEHGYTIDEDLSSESQEENEQAADATAAAWMLPAPLNIDAPYSSTKVMAAASNLAVHPAVVVGRLHHEGKLPWSHLNGLVPNVRDQLQGW